MWESATVLHVDGDEGWLDRTADHLRETAERVEVRAARRRSAALDHLEEADCVVVSLDLADGDGLDFLETVRETDPDLPVVVFGDAPPAAAAGEALDRGATDYVRKRRDQTQFDLLVQRVRRAVREHRWRTTARRERYLSELAAKTDDVLYVVSGDWSEVLFVNDAYEDVWGRPVEELKADPESFMQAVHAGDRERVAASVERLAGGDPDTIEYRVVHPDGELRWVRGQSKPVFEDGEVARIVGFVRDVTERKARERRLRQFQTIVETTDDAAILIDDDWRVTYANEAAVENVGTTPDAAHGAPIMPMVEEYAAPDEDPERFARTLEAAFSTDDPEQFADRLEFTLSVDGERSVFEYQVSPVVGKDPRAVAITTRDITDRKTRERDLRRQNERLEEFAGVVSHDLRNPLTLAQGRVELAMAECDSEHLSDAASALERGQTLIDDLLELARQGETVDEKSPVDLSEVASRARETVALPAGASIEIPAETRLRADPSRLRELLENLFHNSVEHGTDGGRPGPEDAAGRGPADGQSPGDADGRPPDDDVEAGGVTVVVEDLPEQAGFAVEDDGPGIPNNEREQVFEPGHSTTHDGTGFGLAIVERIADAHGWEVTVTDGSDGGARFEVTGVDVVD